MGGVLMSVLMRGDTAQEAFDEARRRAKYDHGDFGYSGSIAEKDEYIVIEQEGDPKVWEELCQHAGGLFEGALLMFEHLDNEQYGDWLADWVRKYTNGELTFDVVFEDKGAHGLALLSKVASVDTIRTWQRTFSDKWSPALCLEVEEHRFLFCGVASG